jgi:hypothetical protein
MGTGFVWPRWALQLHWRRAREQTQSSVCVGTVGSKQRPGVSRRGPIDNRSDGSGTTDCFAPRVSRSSHETASRQGQMRDAAVERSENIDARDID